MLAYLTSIKERADRRQQGVVSVQGEDGSWTKVKGISRVTVSSDLT